VYDDGKEGLPNIQVLLYDSEGNVAAVALTDVNGDYEFSALAPGDYYILVNKDPSYNHSPVVVGGNQVSSVKNVKFGNSSPSITLAKAAVILPYWWVCGSLLSWVIKYGTISMAMGYSKPANQEWKAFLPF